MAIILYYTFMGANHKAVSELIDLKIGIGKVKPKHCQQRIDFIRNEDFPSKHRPWNYEGVGQEIAEHVDFDTLDLNTFLSLTEIDNDCDILLSKYKDKCKDIRLDELKNDRNPCKEAAIAAIKKKTQDHERMLQEAQRKAQESKRRAKEAEKANRFRPYSEHVSQVNPPQPQPWKDDADDEVIGYRSVFSEGV